MHDCRTKFLYDFNNFIYNPYPRSMNDEFNNQNFIDLLSQLLPPLKVLPVVNIDLSYERMTIKELEGGSWYSKI